MTYTYEMGLIANGVPLPDPSEWNFEVADLDTSAKRDVTGLLHRSRVATKVNYEFQWKGLDWAMLEKILNAVSPDKFTLIAPDPRTFNTTYSGDYYVGNRTGNNLYYWPDRENVAVYTLKFKFIQY